MRRFRSPEVSATGRYITFHTAGTQIDIGFLGLDGLQHSDHFDVSGLTNGNFVQVYFYDRVDHTLEMVSSTGGFSGNGNSGSLNFGGAGDDNDWQSSISADGRFVAFQSDASNLVAGDGNGQTDVFVYDRQSHQITRISVSGVGAEANGASYRPVISPDGRYVVFASDATNLVAGDDNGVADTFVYDLQGFTVQRLSQRPDETDGNLQSLWGDAASRGAVFVAYGSEATNLADNDVNNASDIIVADRFSGTVGILLDDPAQTELTTSGKLAFTDLNSNTVSATNVGTPWGTLQAVVTTNTTGGNTAGVVTWSYSVDEALARQLSFGQRHIDTFNVIITDSGGGTATQTVPAIVLGVNEHTVITGADAAADISVGAGATGEIDFTDVDLADVHGATAIYIGSTGEGPAGALGSLNLVKLSDTTGTGLGGQFQWSYSVDPASLAFLDLGESRTENFIVRVSDGVGFTNRSGSGDDPRRQRPAGGQSRHAGRGRGHAYHLRSGGPRRQRRRRNPELDQPLTIASVESGAGGTAVLNQNGTVTFTPAANFNGPASFSYTVSDGITVSAPATVTVNVVSANDPPVANPDTLAAAEDTAVTYAAADLVGNDDDGDPELDQPLTIASVESGAGGTAVLNQNGTVTFTPAAGFSGPASFSYTVSDGITSSAPAT